MSTATKPETPPAQGASANQGSLGRLAIAAVVVIAAVAAGWYYLEYVRKPSHESAGTARGGGEEHAGGAEGAEVSVQVVRLSPGGIMKTSTQIGSVEPFEGADLFAKISGYLQVLKVDYGDHVKRDQLLAEIDDPEVVEDAKKAAADVLQAKAGVTQAEAFIESAKADADASASSVEQAVAEVARYHSMVSFHEKKDARYKDLVAKQAIPQQIADEEDEAYESAKASEVASQKAVLNSKAQLIAAKAKVKKAEADLAEAKANVTVAEAKKGRADVLVGYTKIKSPYNGVITKRNFFPGDFIRSASEGGTMPVLIVARTDKVRVVTQVPDRDVPYTDVGDPCEITLDALGGDVIKGKVSRFAETEDPTSRTMHTEIDLPNPDNRLRAGMYGVAKIILDTDTKSSTLPTRCLVGESKEGKADVYVVRDGKAKKTQIGVGADDGLRVEVRSGLKPDDDVIADIGSVTDKTPVKIDRDEPAAEQGDAAREPKTKESHGP